MEARKLLFFEQHDAMPSLRTASPRRSSRLVHPPLRRRADVRATTEAQSTALGGGPSWMRSPMYEPMSVKSTPMVAMITYMNVGMVRTVWLRTK